MDIIKWKSPLVVFPTQPYAYKQNTTTKTYHLCLECILRNSTLFRASFPWRCHDYGNVQYVGQHVCCLYSNIMSMITHPLWYSFLSLWLILRHFNHHKKSVGRVQYKRKLFERKLPGLKEVFSSRNLLEGTVENHENPHP
jgi:hypothetical protein